MGTKAGLAAFGTRWQADPLARGCKRRWARGTRVARSLPEASAALETFSHVLGAC